MNAPIRKIKTEASLRKAYPPFGETMDAYNRAVAVEQHELASRLFEKAQVMAAAFRAGAEWQARVHK